MNRNDPCLKEESTPSLFQTLQYQAFRKGLTARTTESRAWFREKIKEMGGVNRSRLLDDAALHRVNAPLVGSMFMYVYDPKHKKTLPYYDRFPLIFMVDSAPGGFYGMNLHYLAPVLRAKLFDKLLETKNTRGIDDSTKLKLSYGILKSTTKFSAFRPTFKHYLTDHVKSKIVMVPAPEWEIAIFLPTQQFEKQTDRYVWARSTLGKAF